MRQTRSRGFTIVELMIVVAVIAIVMAISVPNFLVARISANESAAIANLRTIASAQAQYQSAARADLDVDGLGEFGTLAEMGGARGVRTAVDGTAGVPLTAAVLTPSFGRLNVNGEASRSGYLYRVFLPAQGGQSLTEVTEDGDFSGNLDVDECETTWCVYAWPQDVTRSGNRPFFINQAASITGAEASYSGTASIAPSNAGAAFIAGNPPGSILGELAVSTTGVDGNHWRVSR